MDTTSLGGSPQDYQHPRARTWSSTPTSTAWRTRGGAQGWTARPLRWTVSSVVFASDPVNDDTYGSGEWVAARVKFDEDVLLPAPPQLSLDIGGVARYGGIRPRPIRESPLPQQALRGPPGGLFGYRRRLHRREHAESEQRRHPGRDLQPNSATLLPTSSDASPMRPPVASWGQPGHPLVSRITSSKRRGRRAGSFGVPVFGCVGMEYPVEVKIPGPRLRKQTRAGY